MSKFFNEVRKAQDWSLREGDAPMASTVQALETLKKTDGLANEIGDVRLGRCRKIHLPMDAKKSHILSGPDSGHFAVESYRALRTRLMRAQAAQGLRSIVLSSALSGEGKTLTAMNLALCYAQQQDLRVLVIDGDLRKRSLTELLGFPGVPGLAEILVEKAQFVDAILATDVPNLYVLGAGSPSAPPTDLYSRKSWKEFIGWCSETFKVILVDSPPVLPLADFELISSACDGVLIVVRAHSTRRDLLQKVAGQLDPKKLVGVVFNGADHQKGNELYYQAYPGNSNTL